MHLGRNTGRQMKKQTHYAASKNCEMAAIQLQCRRCGVCCRILGPAGLEVTEEEWEALENDMYSLKLDIGTIEQLKQGLRLPMKVRHTISGCAFLTGTNKCQVYDRRPRACREFPFWITETPTQVVLKVALLCTRASELASVLQNNPPECIRILIGERQHNIVLV